MTTREERIKAESERQYRMGLPWTLAVFRAEQVEAEREKELRSKPRRAGAHRVRAVGAGAGPDGGPWTAGTWGESR